MRRCTRAMLLATAALFAGASARADDVTDQFRAAQSAYEHKDLSAALAALETAENLIRQQKADAWKTVLPDPLPGWTAEPAEAVAVGTAVLGGGISTDRTYRRGTDSVTISLISDSPMLQGLSALLKLGILASGTRRLVIAGQPVAYQADDNTLQTVVGEKVLVKVDGSGAVDQATLEAYFKAIKLAEVARLAR